MQRLALVLAFTALAGCASAPDSAPPSPAPAVAEDCAVDCDEWPAIALDGCDALTFAIPLEEDIYELPPPFAAWRPSIVSTAPLARQVLSVEVWSCAHGTLPEGAAIEGVLLGLVSVLVEDPGFGIDGVTHHYDLAVLAPAGPLSDRLRAHGVLVEPSELTFTDGPAGRTASSTGNESFEATAHHLDATDDSFHWPDAHYSAAAAFGMDWTCDPSSGDSVGYVRPSSGVLMDAVGPTGLLRGGNSQLSGCQLSIELPLRDA